MKKRRTVLAMQIKHKKTINKFQKQICLLEKAKKCDLFVYFMLCKYVLVKMAVLSTKAFPRRANLSLYKRVKA